MIKIFINEMELDVVKETLSISKESKLLDNDFKIQNSSYPFLIIENEKSRQLLGSNHLSSVSKKTYHQVKVLTPEGVFNGELQILSYTKNFRKCNLIFYSPIFDLRDKKIGDFLPDRIYANASSSASPPSFDYEEKRETLIPTQHLHIWQNFGNAILKKGFPETLFNLPEYSFPTKFGNDLQEGDEWYRYLGSINNVFYDNGERYMYANHYIDLGGVHFINQTVNAPQVYLLAPLKQALDSIGYKMKGNFVENEFVKRLLFYSDKNNLTEVKLKSFVLELPSNEINSAPWLPYGMSHGKYVQFGVTVGKKYRIEIELKNNTGFPITGQITSSGIYVSVDKELFSDTSFNTVESYSADFIAPITNTSGSSQIQITFLTPMWYLNNPLTVLSLKIYEIAENTGYLTHPIINLQRYVPEWSFVDYLNEMKKLFNLKITANDHDKSLSLDFMNDKFIQKKSTEIDNLELSDPETLEYDSLLLAYDNDIDDNILISNNDLKIGKNKPKNHTHEVKSKFKFMPVNENGIIITDELEDKGGVGLIIFNHGNIGASKVLKSYNGSSLNLENIFKNAHELSFKNYLAGSIIPAKAYLSNKQIKDIGNNDFIISNNKRYYVNKLEYKQTDKGMYDASLELFYMIY